MSTSFPIEERSPQRPQRWGFSLSLFLLDVQYLQSTILEVVAMPSKKPDPLIGVLVERVEIDYGIKPEEYGPGDEISTEDTHSATVVLTLELVPYGKLSGIGIPPLPKLPDVNRVVEDIVMELNKRNDRTAAEYRNRRKAEEQR